MEPAAWPLSVSACWHLCEGAEQSQEVVTWREEVVSGKDGNFTLQMSVLLKTKKQKQENKHVFLSQLKKIRQPSMGNGMAQEWH